MVTTWRDFSICSLHEVFLVCVKGAFLSSMRASIEISGIVHMIRKVNSVDTALMM
jgi:hypothetical protein